MKQAARPCWTTGASAAALAPLSVPHAGTFWRDAGLTCLRNHSRIIVQILASGRVLPVHGPVLPKTHGRRILQLGQTLRVSIPPTSCFRQGS